jgi:hypothetical protein
MYGFVIFFSYIVLVLKYVVSLYSIIGDFLMTLRLFKGVVFLFLGRKTLQICYVTNFRYNCETQMHGTTHMDI